MEKYTVDPKEITVVKCKFTIKFLSKNTVNFLLSVIPFSQGHFICLLFPRFLYTASMT